MMSLFCYFLIQVHGKRSVMMMNLLSQSQPTQDKFSAFNRAAQNEKQEEKHKKEKLNYESF